MNGPASGALTRRIPLLITLSVVCALVLLTAHVDGALADGGQTIAAAAPVTVGQEMSGDTNNGGGSVSRRYSWWGLNVNAGDQVEVSGGVAPGAFFQHLHVYRVGTTDGNWNAYGQELKRAMITSSSTSRVVAKFIAPTAGVMPISIEGHKSSSGPYFFTVQVKPPAPHAYDARVYIAKGGLLSFAWHISRDCTTQVATSWLNAWQAGPQISFPTAKASCSAIGPSGNPFWKIVRWPLSGPAYRKAMRAKAARSLVRPRLTLVTTDEVGQVATQTFRFTAPVGRGTWVPSS